MKIIIDGVEIQTTELLINDAVEGVSKLNVEFKFQVIGKSETILYENSLKDEGVAISIPDKNFEFKATKVKYEKSYNGFLEEDPNLPVRFSVVYEEALENEVDSEEPWDDLMGVAQTALSNWCRTRAISELLIHHGIITKEEYDEKIEEVSNRDFEEMKRFMVEGK